MHTLNHNASLFLCRTCSCPDMAFSSYVKDFAVTHSIQRLASWPSASCAVAVLVHKLYPKRPPSITTALLGHHTEAKSTNVDEDNTTMGPAKPSPTSSEFTLDLLSGPAGHPTLILRSNVGLQAAIQLLSTPNRHSRNTTETPAHRDEFSHLDSAAQSDEGYQHVGTSRLALMVLAAAPLQRRASY